MNKLRFTAATMLIVLFGCSAGPGEVRGAGASLGGFVPFVGIGLTDEFKDFDSLDGTFFIADPSNGPDPMAEFLGVGTSTYYDLAILDLGAATHVLSHDAYLDFDIQGEGFAGTETQPIGTANGILNLEIDKALGLYAAGLGDGMSDGTNLMMNEGALRGQTSVTVLSAPPEWTLPSIVGLPIAAHHAIAILNDDPQIFPHQGRTVRTPNVELRDLGSGGGEILRRADLKIRPGENFIIGPIYTFTIDIDGQLNVIVTPTSPSVVQNGGIFVEVDMIDGSESFTDQELLLDTGADLTVLSEITAKQLGFDAVLDTPDFVLEVETPNGVEEGVPGFFVDELNIDTVGGSFTLNNVPVAVINLPDPHDPGNVVDGILGMHVFNDRNIVIDAVPAIGQGGDGPSLYISDSITQGHSWATAAASENWTTAGNWDAAGTPDELWLAQVANVSASDQQAVVAIDSTVYRVVVSGTETAEMSVQINTGATLTVFGETLIEEGGRVELAGGKLDTQFVNIDGGTLAGEGEVFAGTGPIHSPVRNLSGRVEPGSPVGRLTIDGDFSNQSGGTLAIDLGGTTVVDQYDQLAVDRFAFLDGILEVSLVDLGLGTFEPMVGDEFTIITADEGISGMFDQFLLPSGYIWDYELASLDTEFILKVVGIGVPGDYNGNGTVDAADYAVWRDLLGQSGAGLAADGTGDDLLGMPDGDVDEFDYEFWRAHFGETGGAGALGGGGAAVPEPASIGLLLVAATVLAAGRRGPDRVSPPVRSAASIRCATSWPK